MRSAPLPLPQAAVAQQGLGIAHRSAPPGHPALRTHGVRLVASVPDASKGLPLDPQVASQNPRSDLARNFTNPASASSSRMPAQALQPAVRVQAHGSSAAARPLPAKALDATAPPLHATLPTRPAVVGVRAATGEGVVIAAPSDFSARPATSNRQPSAPGGAQLLVVPSTLPSTSISPAASDATLSPATPFVVPAMPAATASVQRRLVAELSQAPPVATVRGGTVLLASPTSPSTPPNISRALQPGNQQPVTSGAVSMPLAVGNGGSSLIDNWRVAPMGAVAAPTFAEGALRNFRSPAPFYWVQSVETISEFEVGGAFGEVVTKLGDFKDENSALPIAGTLRMAKGGMYTWTIQVVKQCPHRPHFLFGIQGAAHARPWRLVSSGRCSRSRDDGPWAVRPGGDLMIRPGDYLHCEADLRGLDGALGSFSFAVNAGPFETAFEDIPLSDVPLHPVLCMGGAGTTCRLFDG